jgi:hypothetical protein
MASKENEPEKAPTGTLMELANLAPGSIIRTETVLSRMPIHNLAKKGSINIHIVRKGADGQIDLSWRVSPNRDYGEPRQLAYKVDTLIINRHIDESGRPLPPMIALGSIRQICRELGINEGKGSNDVKRALLQNSSAFISAKLTYKGNDGAIRRLDANFARYSVIFTGEKLPDGRSADGVYLILNEPYREVLNNAPVRPLNYDYLRELPPTQQRFYEIVSYRMFAALKFRQLEAKLTYSEYCTYSAQQRYFDYDRFKKQMYKVHRPHLASGYLKSLRFQETQDAEGQKDWFMYYVPGPKARAEYNAFSNAGRLPEASVEALDASSGDAPATRIGAGRRRAAGPRQKAFRFEPGITQDDPILKELTQRGIAERRALELIEGSKNREGIIDQLEWGDHLVANSRSPIANPAGFYVYLLRENVTPPETFETRRQREARELARQARSEQEQRRYEIETAYAAYRTAETERYIAAHVTATELEGIIKEKIAERRKQYRSLTASVLRGIAERDARIVLADRIAFLTLEEFERTHTATPA